MAPGISQVHANGYKGTHRNAAAAAAYADHEIPDIVYNDPSNRRIKVLCIGAGVSGIGLAYKIQKHCENVQLDIYEKNQDIGGTWFLNRYPGAACDIPSHSYQFNFALYPEWPKYFSYSPDIWAYLDKVCKCFDLRKYMTFNTKVIGCYWNQDEGIWTVKLQESREGQGLEPGLEPEVFEKRCHVLVHATGVLNNYKWPDFEGLDEFKGKVIHTARWPQEYQKDSWKNERVAVIGSGASSIQTVPNMQPHVKHMDVFVRTPIWFCQIVENFGVNTEYTPEQREKFRTDVHSLVQHAKDLENAVNGLWGAFYKGSEMQNMFVDIAKKRMAEFIKDERLLKGLTPTFGLGCRRITPGDPYMIAIQEPNVDVHFTPVVKATADGVVGEDGIERKVDTIICATGFDTSFRPHFPIVGLNGVDLADKWKICPEAYLGLAVPDMPNFFTFIGPTWPIENGSVMGGIVAVADYTIQVIKKLQGDSIKSLTPKQHFTDLFNEHVQKWVQSTIWTDKCRSWYKNNETGRVNAIWPGSTLHFIRVLEHPRYEHYDVEYLNEKNPWDFIGMGWALDDKAEQGDKSPYVQVENLDPEWVKMAVTSAS